MTLGFFHRAAIGVSLFVGAMAITTSTAFAWGCTAEGSQKAVGYSQSFDNEQEARDWAMSECSNRSVEGESCDIIRCDVNN